MTVLTNIVTLRNATTGQLSQIGEKAVNLALLKQNFTVPQAIIVTNQAFQNFLEQTGLKHRIAQLLAVQDTGTIEARTQAAHTIKEMIMESQIPEYIFEEIKEAYFAININQDVSVNAMMEEVDAPVVAIRPSPVGYKCPDVHTSILNIRGPERLQKAILLCWASYYNGDALEVKKSDCGFAIIIQKMIDSKSAGELHTEYKMNSDEVLILGCKGLGSALSKGLITPDKYFITKSSLAVANIQIGKQLFMHERDIDTDKTTKVYLQEDYAKKQKVPDQHVGELTLLSRKIEEMFGKPQIVDFAICKEIVYVLGSRVPDWYEERLQQAEEQKRQQEEKRAAMMQEPSEEEVAKKQDEISYGIVEELDKDDLVTAATGDHTVSEVEEVQEAVQSQDPQPSEVLSTEPQEETPAIQATESTSQESPELPEKEERVILQSEEANEQRVQEEALALAAQTEEKSLERMQPETIEERQQEQGEPQREETTMPEYAPIRQGTREETTDQTILQKQGEMQTGEPNLEQQMKQRIKEITEQIPETLIGQSPASGTVEQPTEQESSTNQVKEELSAPEQPLTEPLSIKEHVAAMRAAVQEIQKPAQTEGPTLTNLEEMEQKEDEFLNKIKEEKGDVDINDLVMSIDSTALEKEMERMPEPAMQEQSELPMPVIEEQPKSQVITESLNPTLEEASTVEAEESEVVTQDPTAPLPTAEEQVIERELTEVEKASGLMIVQCFKEIKNKIPQEQWSSHADVIHLAVLAQKYMEKKIPPSRKQVQYAMDALEKVKNLS